MLYIFTCSSSSFLYCGMFVLCLAQNPQLIVYRRREGLFERVHFSTMPVVRILSSMVHSIVLMRMFVFLPMYAVTRHINVWWDFWSVCPSSRGEGSWACPFSHRTASLTWGRGSSWAVLVHDPYRRALWCERTQWIYYPEYRTTHSIPPPPDFCCACWEAFCDGCLCGLY